MMANIKKPACVLTACALVFLLCLPLGAAASSQPAQGFLARPAALAAAWLRRQLPNPTVGHEAAVLALLQGETPESDTAITAHYVDALSTHLAAGGARSQPLWQSGLQLLILGAANQGGSTEAEVLLEAFATEDSLMQAGPQAAAMALLLFGPAGAATPPGLGNQTLAAGLVASQAEDGSFAQQGESSITTTARVLAALACHTQLPGAGDAIGRAVAFLQEKQSPFGGFETAEETAEVVLALACLPGTALRADAPAPAEALLVFQKEDGGFSHSPDAGSDAGLTGLCALALCANGRAQAGLAGVYALGQGAFPVAVQPLPLPESAPPQVPGTAQGAFRWPVLQLPYIGAVALYWVLAAGGVLLLIIIIIAAARSRKKRKTGRGGKSPLEQSMAAGKKTTGNKKGRRQKNLHKLSLPGEPRRSRQEEPDLSGYPTPAAARHIPGAGLYPAPGNATGPVIASGRRGAVPPGTPSLNEKLPPPQAAPKKVEKPLENTEKIVYKRNKPN